MTRLAAALLAALWLVPAAGGAQPATGAPAPAAAPAAPGSVPARIRVIKGERKGPAKLDPKLGDLKRQLGKLAYQRWDQLEERHAVMALQQTQWVDLPSGDPVGLTVQEVHGNAVTVEVALSHRNTVSRVTIERGQRIVHQVTKEKDGVAYFVTLSAWPGSGP